MTLNPLLAGLPAVHPGAILKEDVLPALGRSKSEIADLLGVSRPTLYEVLNGDRAITVPFALRLAKLTGSQASLWLTLQQNFDLRVQSGVMAEDLARIPTLEVAAD